MRSLLYFFLLCSLLISFTSYAGPCCKWNAQLIKRVDKIGGKILSRKDKSVGWDSTSIKLFDSDILCKIPAGKALDDKNMLRYIKCYVKGYEVRNQVRLDCDKVKVSKLIGASVNIFKGGNEYILYLSCSAK